MKNIKLNLFILLLMFVFSVQTVQARPFNLFGSEERQEIKKADVIEHRNNDLETPRKLDVADHKNDSFGSFDKPKVIDHKNDDFAKPEMQELAKDKKEAVLEEKNRAFRKYKTPEEKKLEKELALEVKRKKEAKALKVLKAKKMNKEVVYEENFEDYQMKKKHQKIIKDKIREKTEGSEFSKLTKKQIFQMVKSMDSSGADFYESTYKDIKKINMKKDDDMKKFVKDNLSNINTYRVYGAKNKADFEKKIREEERYKREINNGNNENINRMGQRLQETTGLSLQQLENASPIKIN